MPTAAFLERRLRQYERRYRRLAAQLADVGYIYQGTIVRQMVKCGKPRCACYEDSNRRHGPYIYWSTKVGGKTVSRLLNKREASVIEPWIANRRRLEAIQKRMLKVSEEVAQILWTQEVDMGAGRFKHLRR